MNVLQLAGGMALAIVVVFALLFRRFQVSMNGVADDIDEQRRAALRHRLSSANGSATSRNELVDPPKEPSAIALSEDSSAPETVAAQEETQPALPTEPAEGKPEQYPPDQDSSGPPAYSSFVLVSRSDPSPPPDKTVEPSRQPMPDSKLATVSRPPLEAKSSYSDRWMRHYDSLGSEITAAYNLSADTFQNRFSPERACLADSQGFSKLGLPRIEPEYDGEFWMVARDPGAWYAVPYAGLEFDESTNRTMAQAFEIRGVRPGYRYRKVRLLRPAEFSSVGLTARGLLVLEEEEPDADSI